MSANVSTATLEDAGALVGIDYSEPGSLYPDFRGINYDPAMSSKEIAATVRRHLSAAVKAGALGSAVRVSVRLDRFAGGCGIRVVLTVPQILADASTPGAVLLREWPGGDHAPLVWAVPVNEGSAVAGWKDRKVPEARDAEDKAAAFLETFNRDRSNSLVDYWHVTFYGSVTLEEVAQS